MKAVKPFGLALALGAAMLATVGFAQAQQQQVVNVGISYSSTTWSWYDINDSTIDVSSAT